MQVDIGSEPTERDLGLKETSVFAADGSVSVPLFEEGHGFVLGDIVADRYVVTEKLGQGGCGFVYAAHDRQLDIAVALKTLRPDIEMSAGAVAELKSEILMARRVTHTNVCRIYDFGVHQGESGSVCFLTMELIRGETLADRMARQGRIALADMAPIAMQVLAALDAAHEAGVVHADLKPANILLTESSDGVRAVVTDFGLATAHTSDLEDDRVTHGTPAYMAPEQVKGRSLKPAADYYSLGCTLYHALSGDFPFLRKTVKETALARLDTDAPRLGNDISGKWVDIVAGLMEREQSARLSSADIRRTLDTEPRRRRLQLAGAVAVTAALAAALAIGLTWEGTADRLQLSEPADRDALAAVVAAEDLISTRLRSLAVEDMQAVHKKVGDHPRVLAALAEASFDSRSREQGFALIDRAVELAAHADEREYYRTIAFRLRGQYTEANDLLARLAGRYPADVRVGSDLIGVQLHLKLVDLARETVEDLEPRGPNEESQVRLARLEIEVQSQNFGVVLEHAQALREFAATADRPVLATYAKAAEANAHRQLGDHDEATRLADEVVGEASALGRMELVLSAHRTLVPIAMMRENYTRARELVQRERDYFAAQGDEPRRDQTEITFVEVLAATGATEQAMVELDAITKVLRDSKSHYWTAYALSIRSELHAMRGELDAAIADCESSETIFRATNSVRLASFALAQCARAKLEAGQLEAAKAAIASSLAIREQRKLAFLVAQSRLVRAEIEMAAGQPGAARKSARQAVDLFASKKLGNDQARGEAVLARLALSRGDLEAARASTARARSLRTGNGWEVGLELDTLDALLDAVSGNDQPAAIARLRRVIAKAERGGYIMMALDAQKALSTALAAAGQDGATVAQAAETRAKAAGIVLFRY